MRCNGCGKLLDDNVEFCPVCGKKTAAAAPYAPSQTQADTTKRAHQQSSSTWGKGEAVAAVRQSAANGAKVALAGKKLPSKMIIIIAGMILAVVIVLLLVMFNTNSRKIVGKWKVVEIVDRGENVDFPEDNAYEFRKDGTLEETRNGRQLAYTYTVSDNTLSIIRSSRDVMMHMTMNDTENYNIQKLTGTEMILVYTINGHTTVKTFRKI